MHRHPPPRNDAHHHAPPCTTTHHHAPPSEESLQASAAAKLGDVFGGKKLCGDVFGSSRDAESTDSSLMYKSRTGFGSPLDGGVVSKGPTSGSKPSSRRGGEEGGESAFEIDRQQGAALELAADDGMASSPGDKIFGFDEESESDNDEEAISALTQRQRLALTLKNWCMVEKNVEIVLKENGVTPLLSMSKAPAEDVKVRRYTAQAFFHLSEKSRFRKQLIDEGVSHSYSHADAARAETLRGCARGPRGRGTSHVTYRHSSPTQPDPTDPNVLSRRHRPIHTSAHP